MSTKQADRKSLHMVIQDLKERLFDGEIKLHHCIPTGLIWADVLTNEMEMHQDMRELLQEGNFKLVNEGISKVQCIDGEIRMMNIGNRDKKDQPEGIEKVC